MGEQAMNCDFVFLPRTYDKFSERRFYQFRRLRDALVRGFAGDCSSKNGSKAID